MCGMGVCVCVCVRVCVQVCGAVCVVCGVGVKGVKIKAARGREKAKGCHARGKANVKT